MTDPTHSLESAIRSALEAHLTYGPESGWDCSCGWEPEGAEDRGEAQWLYRAHQVASLTAAVTTWLHSQREAVAEALRGCDWRQGVSEAVDVDALSAVAITTLTGETT